jgi:hypothetical protein
MINFFRKIRQKLLTENNFSKYLIYAIGEILLVVIGIIIALQVNTWNENRKRNIEELEYLKRLNKDMSVSIEKTQIYTDFMINTANRSTSILKNLRDCSIPVSDRKAFINGLYHIGKLAPPIFVDGTVIELQSTGKILTIRNVTLREKLTTMIGVYEEFNAIFSQVEGRVSPHINYIDEKISYKIESPTRGNSELNWEDAYFNFDSLCKDDRFIAAISALRNYTYDVAKWNDLTLKEFKTFQEALQKELDIKE